MKRISGGFCGYYSGSFICSGLQDLGGVFYSSSTCLWNSNGGVTSGGRFEYSHNNFFALPQQAEGMRMSVSYVPKFSGDSMTYPEQCISGGGSFIYKQILSGGVLYPGDSICTANSRENYDSGARVVLAPTNSPKLPCFTSGSGILQPGILEPMITVSMPPVTTDFVTGLDSVLDGVIITLKGLNVWRTYVDASLKAVKNVIGGFDLKKTRPLADGLEENPCRQFKIYKSGGELIACYKSQVPYFGVTSGAVIIDDESVAVEEHKAVQFDEYPVNFYLDVDAVNKTAEIISVVGETAADYIIEEEGHHLYHIGGISNFASKDTKGCSIYSIWQAQCDFSIDGQSDEGDSKAFIGVVVSAPTTGYGTGAVRHITVDGNGAYTAVDADISVVFPYIG